MSKFKECEVCGAALDPGEKCDCENEKYLPAIRCTQPPIIAENLDSVRQNLEILLADIGTLPQNDDALKYVKTIRANLAKEFDRYESQRKAVKKAVMEPYDQANQKYTEFIAKPYKDADERLKKWVDHYQGELKQKCVDGLRNYFAELCQVNGIDFLPFHACGITVDMAMARQKEPRKAMDQIDAVVSRVRGDIETILRLENAEEVMAEYRKFPVLSEAIITVENRKLQQEQTRLYLEVKRQKQEAEEAMQAAIRAELHEAVPQLEEKYSVCFRATGTLSALKAMKANAQALGITFEEINQEEDNDE